MPNLKTVDAGWHCSQKQNGMYAHLDNDKMLVGIALKDRVVSMPTLNTVRVVGTRFKHCWYHKWCIWPFDAHRYICLVCQVFSRIDTPCHLLVIYNICRFTIVLSICLICLHKQNIYNVYNCSFVTYN